MVKGKKSDSNTNNKSHLYHKIGGPIAMSGVRRVRGRGGTTSNSFQLISRVDESRRKRKVGKSRVKRTKGTKGKKVGGAVGAVGASLKLIKTAIDGGVDIYKHFRKKDMQKRANATKKYLFTTPVHALKMIKRDNLKWKYHSGPGDWSSIYQISKKAEQGFRKGKKLHCTGRIPFKNEFKVNGKTYVEDGNYYIDRTGDRHLLCRDAEKYYHNGKWKL